MFLKKSVFGPFYFIIENNHNLDQAQTLIVQYIIDQF